MIILDRKAINTSFTPRLITHLERGLYQFTYCLNIISLNEKQGRKMSMPISQHWHNEVIAFYTLGVNVKMVLMGDVHMVQYFMVSITLEGYQKTRKY
eukprot:Pgem_evm1s3836